MLIYFSFENYRSFRGETILDLSATKMAELSGHIVNVGNERILPVTAIYGANASGKSNLFDAFSFMKEYVLGSFSYGGDDDNFKQYRPRPFLFDSSTENADTSFEVFFTVPNDKSEKVYNYGFRIGQSGITEEWFNSRAKTAKKYSKVFHRKGDTFDLSGIQQKGRENILISLERQVLIASLGAKLKVNICKLVTNWFSNVVFADFGSVYTDWFFSRNIPSAFAESESVRQDVVKYFSSFDESIKGFEVKLLPKFGDNDDDRFSVDALHKKIGSTDLVALPFNEESAGTQKMFALYPLLQQVLKSGGVFFIDELHARLHPLLVRNFILTFLDPQININHAQLVFATHDTWQLSNNLLRRDEIWFTEKSENGISILYSLADFVDEDGNKIRKDENYEKNYLLGKYGAIPHLKSINIFEEE